ncbi:FKBP-type peptidyl-prolyl cis-trans isomerase [Aurantibacter sp.]|uniref:FKBP-type peptidyl-prolyl cis-trans isomerase n=1 Tax=Aurantibacter sp. TaxID=2807103 RepID=UPI003266E336
MNKSFLIIIVFFLGFNGLAQKKKDLINEIAQLKATKTELQDKLAAIEKSKEVNLKDSIQEFSYAFGVSIGGNLKTIGFDSISYNTFSVAVKDAIKGEEKITQAEAQNIIQTTIQKVQEAEAKEKSAAGIKFLEENGKRPEVVTTESGLQYEVLSKGEGPIPVASDQVKVHYSGMLIDGTVFDSSIERGEPTVFGVTQVIKGWQEALQLMPVGSKWKVFIPQEIAYGPNGRSPLIAPYSALIFEMELLGIEK